MVIDSQEDLINQIENLVTKIDVQCNNGLIDSAKAKNWLNELEDASCELEKDPKKCSKVISRIRCEFFDELNNQPLKVRLKYLYAIYVWIFLSSLFLILISLIILRILNEFILFANISTEVVAYGGLGACVYSMYYLRKNIYTLTFVKYHTFYWFAYPMAGMIFGLGIVFIAAAGLIQFNAEFPYAAYVSIAFLAGMFQEWIFETLRDIAYTIHKPKGK